jgi:hypothetical protein
MGERLDKNRFFYRLIELDTIFDRRYRQGNHWVSGTHTGIKVIDTNNKNFELKYNPNPFVSDSGATPLKKGVPKNFKTPVTDAVFENKLEQPGVWVLVEFTVEDEILGGGDEMDISGDIYQLDGLTHSSSKLTVADTTTEIFPADDERSVGRLQWKSGSSIWVGNPAELADADWQNICVEIKPGESLEYRSPAALYGKTASGSAVYSRRIDSK